MPHITVEHSFAINKLHLKGLLLTINKNIAKNKGNFNIVDCKSKAILCDDYLVSDGSNSQDFIHISIAIMEGRNSEIIQNLASNLLKIITNFLKENNLFNNQTALSINISEMKKDFYQKTMIKLIQ